MDHGSLAAVFEDRRSDGGKILGIVLEERRGQVLRLAPARMLEV
jgi:hypothetical protein